MLKHERLLWKKGVVHVAGVDEVGRGPLAGPVVAAAVILPEGTVLPGLDDSKAMKPEDREYLFDLIHEQAVAIGLGSVPANEIDTINIYQATFKAMRQAIQGLPVKPERILVDGNRVPESGIPELAIVGGDAASQSIAAASVVAKVTRDREMSQMSKIYPAYGFASHKGYASAEHLKALETNGPCPIHRRSFAPVDAALAAWSRSFQVVRETVASIKRLEELMLYRQQINRNFEGLGELELEEICNRIDRRAYQLKKPGPAVEEAAETWLVQSGYMVLERNLRLGRGEIDLIAQRGDTIAFVEVKTTKGTSDAIEERVTRQKQSRIIDAALHYMDRNPTSLAPRFDVVTVRISEAEAAVHHFTGAFQIPQDSKDGN
jgi:ribonuclease HII